MPISSGILAPKSTVPGVSMKVVLRNPRREVEVAGNRRVKEVLRELDILPETVLGTRGDDLPRHNPPFCPPDFLEFFRNRVREAIPRPRMFARDEPVLVAVSGGKDSL